MDSLHQLETVILLLIAVLALTAVARNLWTGMRGIVSLAAALALPLTTAAGTPLPFRAEIIFVSTFGKNFPWLSTALGNLEL